MAVKYTQRKALLHRRRMDRHDSQHQTRLLAKAQRREMRPPIYRRPLSDLLLLIDGPGFESTDMGKVTGLLQMLRGKGYKREVQAG